MTPTEPTYRLIVADVLDGLAQLPDASVHCVVTSPPYWNLRDYGTATWTGGDPDCDHVEARTRTRRNLARAAEESDGHPRSQANRKDDGGIALLYRAACANCGAQRVDRQIGLEPTIDAHIRRLVEVFRQVRRVLRPDGTLWLNYADAYTSGGNGGGEALQRTNRGSLVGPRPRELRRKQLIGLPWRVAFALQDDGWYLRSDIIWNKTNPMPESVTDRPTKSHEYIFLFSTSERYYYDHVAVREPSVSSRNDSAANFKRATKEASVPGQSMLQHRIDREPTVNTGSRNLRNVWTISTTPFPGAHFATFPTEIPRLALLAGTSQRGVCPNCGAPWKRVIRRCRPGRSWNNEDDKAANINRIDKPSCAQDAYRGKDAATDPQAAGQRMLLGMKSARSAGADHDAKFPAPVTTGWRPTCACPNITQADLVPATVLDPFAGVCTTGLVAIGHGRCAVLIELNPAYAQMGRERIDGGGLLNLSHAQPADEPGSASPFASPAPFCGQSSPREAEAQPCG